MYDELINGIVKRQIEAHPKNDGDYIGEDGFLHCGKCKARKEFEIELFGKMKKVPVLCQCEKDRLHQEEELEEQRYRADKVASLRKSSLMDHKFDDCSFDTVVVTDDNRRQYNVCRRYAEKFNELMKKNQGLLFYGDVGTGKTHFACCIGNYLIEHLTTVFATSFIKVLQKAKCFKDSDEEDAFVDRMNCADLLILDDLGAERGTDYALEIVYHIIDSRYRSGKPMIVTTNLSLADMRDTTDLRYRRIYDRIFEVCYPLEFVGSSLRIKEAADRFDQMKELLEEQK